MRHAFYMAALHYINFTDFGYDLHFHEDETIDVALGHFLYANRQ